MPTLLVVDDEPNVCYSFARVFGDDSTRVISAGTVADGLKLYRTEKPDVIVLDLQLPDGSGLEAFESIRKQSPKQPVIFITAHGTTTTAIEAMKNGAFDYLIKPLDFARVTEILRRAFEAAFLMRVPAVVPFLEPHEQFVGRTPAIQEMCKVIGRVAPQDVNVLIMGESGVGKELVARAIYHHSLRAQKPFLAMNCAALPDGLIESELFGHEQGAFSGADRKRIGKFEQCQDGTIFLDEIGDMSLSAQAKVLRILQDQTFERVGGRDSIKTQVRIIAATNQNLEQRIAEGKFRADLYYRLRGVTINVPPLRERREDIPELAHYFLFQFNKEFGLNVQGFDPETVSILRLYRWPGNVRELQAVMKEAMLKSNGTLLLSEFLPAEVRGLAADHTATRLEADSDGLTAVIEKLLLDGSDNLHSRLMTHAESVLIKRVLKETAGHLGQACKLLGLNRSTLRYKLRELGMTTDRPASDADQMN